jgi:hypothetical protein
MTVEELQIVISSKTEAAMSKIRGLKNAMANLTPQKAPDINVSTAKAQSSLKKLQNELDRTQRKIDKINEKRALLYAQQDTIANKYMDVPTLSGMTQPQTVDFLVDNDPKMQELNAQLDRLDAEMAPLKAHLAETKNRIEGLGLSEVPATERTKRFGRSMLTTSRHIQTAGRHSSYFGRMITSMLLSMALYSGISLIIKSITEGLQNTAQGSDTANKTMSQLATSALYVKNSIASALLPALQAIEPVLTSIANSIANFMTIIGMFTARLFGNATTFTRARRASVDYAKTLGGVSKAAKTAKGSLAAFDQLNVLNKQDNASSGSSAKPGMPAYKDMFEQVPIPTWVNTISDKIKATIAEITAVVSGAFLFVGATLLLSGVDIPLGLGLMAIGAIGMGAAIAANWNSMTTQLRNVLTTILTGFAGFALVIGALLTFTGADVPLGLGLMMMGAASLAAAVAINWGSTKMTLATVLSGITGVVSGATLALGALFAFTGVDIPLGIGLMLVGAVGIAAGVALNWSGLSVQMQGQISMITAIVGGSLLALGAVLAFTGVAPALGLPMMAVGASTLAATIAVNWNSMSDSLRNTLTIITAIVGVAFLALGAVLTFTGVGIPLGIGLMLVGAASLATAAALNWNAITNKIKSVLADILAIASIAAIAIGIILCLTGAGIPLGIGLILAGAAGIHKAASISDTPLVNHIRQIMNSIIGIIESGVNYCIDLLNQISFTIPDWLPGIGGSTFGFNIGRLHIPRLATGGVIKGATPLIAGEAGAEAIVPLERNTEWIDSLAERIVSKVGDSGGSGDINLTIPIYLDHNGSLIDTVIKTVQRRSRSNNAPVFD